MPKLTKHNIKISASDLPADGGVADSGRSLQDGIENALDSDTLEDVIEDNLVKLRKIFVNDVAGGAKISGQDISTFVAGDCIAPSNVRMYHFSVAGLD